MAFNVTAMTPNHKLSILIELVESIQWNRRCKYKALPIELPANGAALPLAALVPTAWKMVPFGI